MSDDISEDGDDAVETPAVKPYAALLQSLAVDSAPAAKRRKLDSSAAQEQIKLAEEDEEVEPNNDVDKVEEAEEGPETAIHGVEDEDVEDATDPFEAHFANPDDNVLSRRLKNLKMNKWSTQKISLPKLEKAVIGLPENEISKEAALPPVVHNPAGLKIKQKLVRPITKLKPTFDSLEQTMAASIFAYRDILFCERTTSNSESLRRLACLHAVNHVFK
jgi:U3 small nucleolar RNA-associated protein 25